MVKISVIVPVYRAEKYVEQCLDSILRQSLEELEVIAVNDGSPDRCGEILEGYAARDPRVLAIHQENGGVSSARNAGLLHAKGKYVYMADSDDWLEERALEVLWNEAERTGADIVYGDYYNVRGEERILQRPFQRPFSTKNEEDIRTLHRALNVGGSGSGVRIAAPACGELGAFGGALWRCLIRRSAISDHRLLFDPELRSMGEDILFMQRVFDYVTCVAYVPVPIYCYRMLEDSLAHGYNERMIPVYDLALRKEEAYLREGGKDEAFWELYYFRVFDYVRRAVKRYYLHAGNPKPARERFREFKAMLERDPYKTGIQKLPLPMLKDAKARVQVRMLRRGLYGAYWAMRSAAQRCGPLR